MTERERKRYEGLFASNRGLHLPPSLPNNICNMVVRDLWMRSRLPRSELETIWNLVIASEPGKPAPPAQLTEQGTVRRGFVAHRSEAERQETAHQGQRDCMGQCQGVAGD